MLFLSHLTNILEEYSFRRDGSIVGASAHNIQQFICDGSLAALVVLEVKLLEQLIGIVGSGLHGNHTGCMLRGIAVEQCRVHHRVEGFRYQRRKHGLQIRLHDEVIIEGLGLCPLSLVFASFFAKILLRLGCSEVGRQVTVVIGTNGLRREVDRQIFATREDTSRHS